MTNLKTVPNDNQIAALKEFAKVHGRNWKSVLRKAWETGNYTGIKPYGDTAAYLQQIRNTYGPSWLTRFVLAKDGGYAVFSARERTATCAWFAYCENAATGTTPHPVLGEVATCDRCHKFATGKARVVAIPAEVKSDARRISEAIAQFPQTFALRGYPGKVFRFSQQSSYINDGAVILYAEVLDGDKWFSFAKGTGAEFNLQVAFLPPAPAEEPIRISANSPFVGGGNSWAPEVIADNSGKWVGNALRFATREEAQANVENLMYRWTLVREIRVVESDDQPNYRWIPGKGLEAIK